MEQYLKKNAVSGTHTYFYHTATLAIGYHADIHSIASVDDKHDFIAKEAHNMFSNAGTNIDLEQAKYFIN